jgi:hypothetical protein
MGMDGSKYDVDVAYASGVAVACGTFDDPTIGIAFARGRFIIIY